MDPRQFHGHDLIGTLQHHEPPTDYDFALTTLAACSAQAHVRKRQMRRLLDIANAVRDHNVGELFLSYLFKNYIIEIKNNKNQISKSVYLYYLNLRKLGILRKFLSKLSV